MPPSTRTGSLVLLSEYNPYVQDDMYVPELPQPEPAPWRQHQYYNGSPMAAGHILSMHSTVVALNAKRREALAEVDEAKFSRFHARVCFVAGVGFFTDAYDIFAINIASTLIGYIYGQGHALNTAQDLGVKIATQTGILFGQLIFGFLADVYGRRKMYGIELVVIVFATLAQALSGAAPAVGIIGSLVVWRFVMGVGIGGDYPLSAIITSEFAPVHLRGRLMAAVFANQGVGQLVAAVVAMIVTVVAKKSATIVSTDVAWRVLLGVGCIPGLIAIGIRYTIPETPRYIMDIARNVDQASQDIDNYLKTGTFYVDPDAPIERVQAPRATKRDFWYYFTRFDNFKILFAACYSWFIIDFAFYGLALNSSIILQAINFSPTVKHAATLEDALSALTRIAEGNLILTGAGLLPGYLATLIFVDRWGRKPIQYTGFGALFAIFAVMGFGYDRFVAGSDSDGGTNHPITPGITAYVFIYCLAYFFQNFGPNTTTFIIPGEIFATRYRSTAHGIASASGKSGAILVQVVFELWLFRTNAGVGGLQDFRKPIRTMFIIFSFLMLTGLVSTWCLPETKNRSLEDLSNESQETFITGPPQPRPPRPPRY